MMRALPVTPLSGALIAFAACIALAAFLDAGERPTAALAGALLSGLCFVSVSSQRHRPLGPALSICFAALALSAFLGGAPLAAGFAALAAAIAWSAPLRSLAAALGAAGVLIALDARALSPGGVLLGLFPFLLGALTLAAWRRRRGQPIAAARADHPVDIARRAGMAEQPITIAYVGLALHGALLSLVADAVARGADRAPAVAHLPAILAVGLFLFGFVAAERLRAYAEARGVAEP